MVRQNDYKTSIISQGHDIRCNINFGTVPNMQADNHFVQHQHPAENPIIPLISGSEDPACIQELAVAGHAQLRAFHLSGLRGHPPDSGVRKAAQLPIGLGLGFVYPRWARVATNARRDGKPAIGIVCDCTMLRLIVIC